MQDKTLASKAPRLKKEQGAIDWSRPAHEIKNQVRGLRPWPRAFTFWHHNGTQPMRLNIDRVSINPLPLGEGRVRDSSVAQVSASPAPGTIVETTNRLLIATGDIPLEILELQPAGKRSMSVAEFLRGYRPMVNDRFGLA